MWSLTGGGEVVHYLARHGESRVRKRRLSAGAAADGKDGKHSGRLPKEVFEGSGAARRQPRPVLYDVPAGPFYGYNRPGAKPLQAVSGTGGARA